MKIVFPPHARQKMLERGASAEEVKEVILHGEQIPAKHGRTALRKNFQYDSKWGETFYHIKQVLAITKKENHDIFVITVFTFYF
jgi:hypothetical protein